MNMMKMATGALTPVIANKLAGALGVPEGIVRKVLSVGLPVLLAAFMKRGASPEGQQALKSAMDQMPENPLSALGDMLGGDADSVRSVSKDGASMLGSILGGSSSSSLVDTLARYVGGNKETVAGLLGVAGAGALGTMKSTARDKGLDTAGILKLMASQKDEIAAAIPADLAGSLGGTGLVPTDILSAAKATKSVSASTAAATATKRSGGLTKWILAAAAVLFLIWLVPQFLGGGNDASDVATSTTLDGVDLGASLTSTLGSLSETLSGVTDAGTAQSALDALTSAQASLSDLQSTVGSLGAEGQAAISALVGDALPNLGTLMTGLLGNSDIAAVLKPVLDGILSTLQAMTP